MLKSEKALISLITHFEPLEDPRSDINQRHQLLDILIIAICAVICGADSFNDIEDFGNAKKDWFQTFLALPNGIPSHDTFRRVFALLSPKHFQECFLSWTQELRQTLDREVVPIDGKTLRGSSDPKKGKSPIHLVSAWASENGLVLGQLQTDSKSNEILAVPELLKRLDLRGKVITSDALNCQTKTIEQIREGGADYVIALKANQRGLYKEVEDLAVRAFENPEEFQISRYKTVEKKHGREEEREYVSINQIENLKRKDKWKDLKSVILVTRQRKDNEKISEEFHYFISSLSVKAEEIGKYIRSHWSIENQLHWRLDVGFREDECRVRSGNAAENLAVLRHIALNLLQKETSKKAGIPRKRKNCGWDNRYLAKVLAG